jgi:hypothetical protein
MFGNVYDIDEGKPKDTEKNLSRCHFVYHKSHWIDPGANQGSLGERPATNRQSHGTVFGFYKIWTIPGLTEQLLASQEGQPRIQFWGK